MLKLLITIAFAISLCYAKTSYDGYRLIELTPSSNEQNELISSWEKDNDFDVWSRSPEITHVLLSPHTFLKYKRQFIHNKIAYKVIDSNIQNKINQQEKSMSTDKAAPIVGRYAGYNDIINYIRDIVDENPAIASTYVAGNRTYENRELRVLVLKTATSSKGLWLDCGIHAREWVSPATCIIIIDRFITGYKNNDTDIVNILNKYEFHILPIVNPDGYEYTRTSTRLWRKNRRPNSGSSCVGTDLNRNYRLQWMLVGATQNPCDDTYAGPSAGSETETKAIESVILNRPGFWDIFLTLHSYGLFWMVPYGYTPTLIPDYNQLKTHGDVGVAATRAYRGTVYRFGAPSTLLYSAAGGSFDWTYGTAGIKWSYCLELYPGQTGTDSAFGFTLPEAMAMNAGVEAHLGLLAMIKSIMG